MWVIGCLDDLASDFSVFHGIRDIGRLRSRDFLRLAARIGAYGGVVTARARASAPVPRRPPGGRAAGAEARVMTPRRAAAALPVASAAELRQALRKVPGSEMWGDVREVKPGD